MAFLKKLLLTHKKKIKKRKEKRQSKSVTSAIPTVVWKALPEE